MFNELKVRFFAKSGPPALLFRSMSAPARILAPFLIVTACLPAAVPADAQEPGYMRMVTSTGKQVAGESTDPAHYGWIPLREAMMPSASQITELAKEPESSNSVAKAVHPPVVVIKDRDKSSLGLLGAMTNHQRFPEVDIVLTRNDDPVARYKLIDTTVISIRVGGTDGGTDAPEEQLRLSYARIEIEH